MSDIRVGLVGAGHISAAHLSAWRRADGFRVHGILDRDRDASASRADRFGVGRVYDQLSELLEECEVVDVCTPPQTHFEIAREAISSGRHLLVEKPVVTSLREWRSLRELLEESPSRVCVLHNLKYSLAVQRAHRWVEQGRIGRVVRLHRLFLTDPETDRMLADRHWSHSLPGGRWFETLPHELYLTYLFAGALPLMGVAGLRTPTAPAGVAADEVAVTLGGEGCLVNLHYSASCGTNRRMLFIEGTEGRIEIDILGDSAILITRRERRWQRVLGGQLLDAARAALGWFPDRLAYFGARARKESAHTRMILAFSCFIAGRGASPTPLDELDYVVAMSEKIGSAIDRSVGKIGEESGE